MTAFLPGWAARLQADGSLTPGLCEAYRLVITRFLDHCRKQGVAITSASAREHVELMRLELAPSPGRLQEWKDALNWFFRRGRESTLSALKGVPPLACSDLGKEGWEQALIRRIRHKHLAWRTEQTYRGWVWRFARFLGRQPLPDAGGAEVRTFLSRLAVEERLGAASQRQALNALVFYFREVAGRELGELGGLYPSAQAGAGAGGAEPGGV